MCGGNLKLYIMKIEITKTVTVTETVNPEKLAVIRTTQKDIESDRFNIEYDGVEIGHGHLNNRSNWAHIRLDADNESLEDYLVQAIESRQIYLD